MNFKFWKSNYTVKRGFLAPDGGGALKEATLYIFNNGTMIVQSYPNEFEVISDNGRIYNVNSPYYPRFLVTE